MKIATVHHPLGPPPSFWRVVEGGGKWSASDHYLRLGLATRANSSRLIFNALPLAFISVICVMTQGHCSLTWRGAQQVRVDYPQAHYYTP
jgi:hypothetical protein